MKNKQTAPGLPRGGWVTPEQDAIKHDIFAIFEETYLDKFTSNHRGLIKIGLSNFYAAFETLKQPTKITDLRNRLDQLQDIIIGFEKELKWAAHDPTISESIHPTTRDIFTIKNQINPLCGELTNLLATAQNALPKKRPGKRDGWPEKIKPTKELLKVIAIIFEQITGKKAISNINHDRSYGVKEMDSFYGEFYELANSVFIALSKMPLPNGDFIEEISGKTMLRALA